MDSLPPTFGELDRPPKLPERLADIFGKAPDPDETLPQEIIGQIGECECCERPVISGTKWSKTVDGRMVCASCVGGG